MFYKCHSECKQAQHKQFPNLSHLATHDKKTKHVGCVYWDTYWNVLKYTLKNIEQPKIRIYNSKHNAEREKEKQFLCFLQHFRSVCHQKLAVAKRNNGEIRYCKYCVPESILIPLKTCGNSKKPNFIFQIIWHRYKTGKFCWQESWHLFFNRHFSKKP